MSNTIKGRSPLTDGFGLIAFASLLPMVECRNLTQLQEFVHDIV